MHRRKFLKLAAGAAGVLVAGDGTTLLLAQTSKPFPTESSAKSQDIYAIIKKDHKNVKNMLEKMEKSADAGALRQDFSEFRKALLPHAKAEESVFYPVLKDSERKAMLKGTSKT